MAEIICSQCQGAGKIEHRCHPGDHLVIKELARIEEPDFKENLTIRKCRVCGQLWMVFYQRCKENSTIVWLKPGEFSTGMKYTRDGMRESYELSFSEDLWLTDNKVS